jgi:peroxiredoxin
MRLFPAAALVLAAAVLNAQGPTNAQGPPPVLRPSPEFTVRLMDGNHLSLSSLRGKVVALLFVHTTCPHCQHASQIFSRLFAEYGARGFQPIDVAFNPMANLYVKDFVTQNNVSYPVGFSPPEDVLNYLGIPVVQRYVVPQIAWIDRKGNIRSQTTPMGEEKFLQESYWRSMIEALTKEPASEPARKTPAHRTTAAKKSPTA